MFNVEFLFGLHQAWFPEAEQARTSVSVATVIRLVSWEEFPTSKWQVCVCVCACVCIKSDFVTYAWY